LPWLIGKENLKGKAEVFQSEDALPK